MSNLSLSIVVFQIFSKIPNRHQLFFDFIIKNIALHQIFES
mgnify:CR=1 FL=1